MILPSRETSGNSLQRQRFFSVVFVALLFNSCNTSSSVNESPIAGQENVFPDELVAFAPYKNNPLFSGTGKNTWDEKIRERGYILKEADGYHLWYTGYREESKDDHMCLGYATSPDGIHWTRYQDKPIFRESWVEDMMVIKHDSIYYMFAEGRGDIAHMLTSTDKIHWTDHGSLVVKQTNGEPLSRGPYGTPTVYVEGDVWYLFYERNDEGIWLATSRDLKAWQNIQDEPVIDNGPELYDKFGVAVNQVIRHGDFYYAYYHGTPTEDWSEWNMNVAVSQDLIEWTKFKGNPILEENKSSGILVHDGMRYRLYTLHEKIDLHFPRQKPENSDGRN